MLMALQKKTMVDETWIDAEGALEIYYFGIVCYFYLMNRDLLVWIVQTMSLVGLGYPIAMALSRSLIQPLFHNIFVDKVSAEAR